MTTYCNWKAVEDVEQATLDQFQADGCDNCEKFLMMKNEPEKVYMCTSANFHSLIAMMSPEDSWVAKWQRIGKSFARGCYAVSVTGKLPDVIINELREQGIDYKSRDTSERT